MTIRMVVSIILLCGILISGILFVNSVDKVCFEVIKSTKTAAETYDIEMLNDIQYDWNNTSNYLSAFIPHEYVDTVTESLERAIAFLNHDTKDEFDAEITRFINQIEVIRQYDIPSVRSIF